MAGWRDKSGGNCATMLNILQLNRGAGARNAG